MRSLWGRIDEQNRGWGGLKSLSDNTITVFESCAKEIQTFYLYYRVIEGVCEPSGGRRRGLMEAEYLVRLGHHSSHYHACAGPGQFVEIPGESCKTLDGE